MNGVNSAKFEQARVAGVPLLLPTWVDECYKLAKEGKRIEDVKKIEKNYLVQPLTGCTISTTGLRGDILSQVKEKIKLYGGIYEADMTKKATHLIAEKPEGAKYDAARLWELPILSQNWIDDCAVKGYRVNYISYIVGNGETLCNGNMKTNYDNAIAPEIGTNANSNHMYLAGCQIYLGDGFTDDQLARMKNYIRASGATRCLDYRSGDCELGITHFVASERSITQTDVKLLKSRRRRPPNIVHCKWLRDCYTSCERKPVASYLVPIPGDTDNDHTLTSRNTEGIVKEFENNNTVITSQKVQLRKKMAATSSSGFGQAGSSFGVDSLLSGLGLPNEPKNTITKTSRKNSNVRPTPLIRSRGNANVGSAPLLNQFTVFGTGNLSAIRNGRYGAATDDIMEVDHICEASRPTFGNSDSLNTLRKDQSQLFSGILFSLDGFTPEFESITRKEIVWNGGSIEDSMPCSMSGQFEKRKLKRYHVLPLACKVAGLSFPKDATVVTDIWLEICTQDKILYDPHQLVIFTPLKIKFPLDEMQGYRISVSGYENLERTHITRLVRLLGAEFDDKLSRHITHLICKFPNGEKYRKAQEWGIPIVDVAWLYAKASPQHHAERRSIGKNKFLTKGQQESIEDTIEDTDMPSPAHPACSNTLRSSSATTMPTQSTMTSGLGFLTDPNYRPQFDTKDALSSLMTPACGSGKDWEFAAVPSVKQSEEDSCRDSSDSQISAIGELFTKNINAALQKTELTSYEHENGDGKEGASGDFSKVLQGVVLFLGQKIKHLRNDILDHAEALGARFAWHLDENCTHYVHRESRITGRFKEFKQAEQKGLIIVSPYWLKECRNAGKRLPESDYSHTYNPKKCLVVKAPRSFSQCTQNAPTCPGKLSDGDRSKSEGPVNTERIGDGPFAGGNNDCTVKVEPDKEKQLAKKQQQETLQSMQALLRRTVSEGTSQRQSGSNASTPYRAPSYNSTDPRSSNTPNSLAPAPLALCRSTAANIVNGQSSSVIPTITNSASFLSASHEELEDTQLDFSQPPNSQPHAHIIVWEDREGQNEKRKIRDQLKQKKKKARLASPEHYQETETIPSTIERESEKSTVKVTNDLRFSSPSPLSSPTSGGFSSSPTALIHSSKPEPSLKRNRKPNSRTR